MKFHLWLKTMLYLFGTHAYWTKRPVLKILISKVRDYSYFCILITVTTYVIERNAVYRL